MTITHPVDERFLCERSGPVHRLAVVLGSPRSRVDVDVAGEGIVSIRHELATNKGKQINTMYIIGPQEAEKISMWLVRK